MSLVDEVLPRLQCGKNQRACCCSLAFNQRATGVSQSANTENIGWRNKKIFRIWLKVRQKTK